MIKFDLLTVSADGSKLLIKASVLDIAGLENVYIKKIYITTQDHYTNGLPSSNAWTKEYSEEDNVREIDLALPDDDINNILLYDIKSNLFFVYIECGGVPTADLPCHLTHPITMGTAYYDCGIKKQMIGQIKELHGRCNIPKRFIDKFLRYKALELALGLQHYTEAIFLYKEFITEEKGTYTTTKSCGCHG